MRIFRRSTAALALSLLAGGAGAAELRIGLSVMPTTADPHFHADAGNFTLHRHLYESLLQWSGDGRLLPLLAESWAPLPSGDGWELRIDPAARFSDGTAVTAEDASASLRRAATIANSPARYTPFLVGLQRVEVVSPQVLRVFTHGPGPLLPNGLTTIMIVPARIAATAQPGDFNPGGPAAIGSGPYRLTEYRQGQGAVLERAAGWWGRAPLPWSEIRLRILPHDAARVAALLAGDVDLIENVPLRDGPRLAATEGLHVARQDGTRIMFLAMSRQAAADNPLRDRRVRRALSLAVNRAALAQQVMDGAAEPAGQLMPPGRASHDPALAPPAMDRAAARRLLAEAGLGDGLRLTLTGTGNRFPNDTRLLQAVAQMWRQAGIEAEVEVLPPAAFFPRLSAGRFSVALSGWLTGPGEPNSFLNAFLATRDAGRGMGALNGTGYGDPRLDALLTQALATADTPRRQGLWRQAARLAFHEDVAMVPLLHVASLWAMRGGIRYAPRMDSLTLAMDAAQAAE
ncbi:ABC transporter substrate-binding protein [Rhodovarius crocodyli]|nr:ABC transporter substrate-binding protein [Rhodovarius crocodyli]